MGFNYSFGLLHMLTDQFGHLEHGDLFFPAEDTLQIIVGIDHNLFLFVLETVFLDIDPKLLGYLSSWYWLGSNNLTQS